MRARQILRTCAFAAIAVGAVARPSSAAPIVFVVSSQAAWQDTGIDILAGDLLEITATGTIRFANPGAFADPDGQPDGGLVAFSNQPVPTVLPHRLVGRIGLSGSLLNLSGFLVGSSFSQVTLTSGRLFLAFNDGFVLADESGLDVGGVGDNSGSYTATIEVTAVPEPTALALLATGLSAVVARMKGQRRRRA